jgi:hypothetical protein
MQIDGEWLLCEDGIVRPVILGEVLTGAGFWEPFEFLLDTGADRTVFSAANLAQTGLQTLLSPDRIAGLGGVAASVEVTTEIRLTHEGSGKVTFRSQDAAVTALESLDMSVLGRDITGLFAVIVDRPGDVVCLVGQRHRYFIEHR